MTQKTKESILEWVWSLCSFILIWGIFTYTLYNFGFSPRHAGQLAIICTLPVSYLGSICGYLRDIIEQRKELVDGLSKIADRLNESKEVDRQLCDELHRQNERDCLNDANKALNS